MTQTGGLYAQALVWVDAGRAVAIATVIETWGSAPRPVGSVMVVDAAGAMAGSVSGGCVEAAVVVAAQDAIAAGRSVVLSYGVTDEDAFAVGLACGGQIRVLVEPVGAVMPVDLLRQIVVAAEARRPVAYEVDLTRGTRRLLGVQAGRSGVLDEGRKFLNVLRPPLRMVIVGAVHIAQALVPMARACGYLPIVVDPRSAFASVDRFPQTELVVDWPDAALAQMELDGHTAVVTLTHDPKLDDPALMAAVTSDVFYVGALGSTRTHAARVARLQAAGLSDAQVARIHGPVGLSLGGRDPAEIAVSTMAQITQVLRQS